MITYQNICPLRSLIVSLRNRGRMLLIVPFLFGSFVVTARQANIYGAVIDQATGEALPFVNVFIASTTIGSVTTKSGKFMIKDVPPGTVEIVASFVGYKTQSQHIKIAGDKVTQVFFSMVPDERQLDEVKLVSKRDKKWERQLARFESVFIGGKYDPFVANTKILNPWVLNFDEGKEKGGRYFSATCDLPLEIENTDLGYRIIYYMERFFQTRNGFHYQGPIQYIDLDSTANPLIKENRQKAYLGSVRHFFKALLTNELEQQGFRVYSVKEANLTSFRTNRLEYEIGNSLDTIPSILAMVNSSKEIGKFEVTSTRRLEVHYLKQSWPNEYYVDAFFPVSWLILKDSLLQVSANGEPTNPENLIISGYMANARVARMLPHNFFPNNENVFFDSQNYLVAREKYKWENLREKPYVFTDKPYYYPGETIWMKTYMFYQNPLMIDTLSRVLHVDLLNMEGGVVKSLLFSIDDGMTSGQIDLPRSLRSGDYVLRAYTNWMLNYPENDIICQPIPILELNTAAVGDKLFVRPENLEEVVITTGKEIYGPREKIDVGLLLTEESGQPLAGNFSVSVTDTVQVKNIPGVPTITSSYESFNRPSPDLIKPRWKHKIEYGISVKGKFFDKKGRPGMGSVVIVQGEYDDYGVVETDSAGEFWASGMHFVDSAEIAAGVMDEGGKLYGTLVLTSAESPSLPEQLPSLGVSVRPTGTPQRDLTQNFDEGYVLLEEVVIEKKKQLPKKDWQYGTVKADKSFTALDLQNTTYPNVLFALRKLMPGVRLQRFPTWSINLGSGTLSDSGTVTKSEPRLVINGNKYMGSENVGTVLFNMSIDQVESLQVYSYLSGTGDSNTYSGVIMIETKDGAEPNPEQLFNKAGFTVFTLKGYTPTMKFPEPNYSNHKESHANSDYRSTLTWAPTIATDPYTGKATFSFYSADLTTTYRIVVEGMTDDNTPFREVKYVRVGR